MLLLCNTILTKRSFESPQDPRPGPGQVRDLSHHDDDETKGSVHSFVQDYIEARKASRSVRTAGPNLKDLDLIVMVTPSDSAESLS